MAAVYEDVLGLVGSTPLVRIRNLGRESPRAEVWAKMEQQNPAGSVKDRIALAMIDAAERDGRLKPGGVVIEPTSGNTGIAVAMVCAVRGYRCILTMPESMSLERRALLAAYGAEVVLTPEQEQMEGAVRRANELAEATKDAFVPHQFDNPENPTMHARTTAREIVAHASGSTAMMRVFCNTAPTPLIVPPVPMPATNASIDSPRIASRISRAVARA